MGIQDVHQDTHQDTQKKTFTTHFTQLWVELQTQLLILIFSLGFPFLSIPAFGGSTIPQVEQQKSALRTLLFIRTEAPSIKEVFESMKSELKSFNVQELILSKQTPFSDFSEEVQKRSPDFLVLMDNQAVEFGIRWNSHTKTKIRGVALMALNLSTLLKNHPDFAGIAFEPPAFTLITQFRYISGMNIRSVLTFYRKSLFSETVEQAREQLKKENIELIAVNVEEEGKENVEKFIRANIPPYFSKPGKYDAVWSMLDSTLLSASLFSQVWVPASSHSTLPILTSIENLVSPQMNFAVFGVTPNLSDLSHQAVQIVEYILKDGIAPSKIGVESVLSVNLVLNWKRARELDYQISDEKLADVKVLK